MPRMIYCQKLATEAEGFDKPPYSGELGQRVYEHISRQAWDEWLDHQTMLINEYRLSLIDPKAREFLETEMEKFLFADGSDKPEQFVEPEEKG